MNHRRRHPRKQPNCTLCTAHRWRGNSADRFRKKEHDPKERPPRRPRRSMSPSQLRRSLRDRIAHVEKKLAEWRRRRWGGPWGQMLIDDCENDLRKMRAQLGALETP